MTTTTEAPTTAPSEEICPPWCLHPPGHIGREDHEDDRIHMGERREIELTMVEPSTSTDPGTRRQCWQTPRLGVTLTARHGARIPYLLVEVGDGKDQWAELTFAEGLELINALTLATDELCATMRAGVAS